MQKAKEAHEACGEAIARGDHQGAMQQVGKILAALKAAARAAQNSGTDTTGLKKTGDTMFSDFDRDIAPQAPPSSLRARLGKMKK